MQYFLFRNIDLGKGEWSGDWVDGNWDDGDWGAGAMSMATGYQIHVIRKTKNAIANGALSYLTSP